MIDVIFRGFDEYFEKDKKLRAELCIRIITHAKNS
jgi:hypothetical protein